MIRITPMKDITYLKGYQHEDTYRKSFNDLALQIFGISFEDWYQKGYWTNSYEPYTIFDDNQAVANVSVNKLDLILDGERKKAIQLGTVMTHPDYRGRGLSAKLMNAVMKDYGQSVDLNYLFANHSVLDYYPKFGFKRAEETKYAVVLQEYEPLGSQNIKQLNGRNDDDLSFIFSYAANRIPVSQNFATDHAEHIMMFYVMNVFFNSIYYLQDLDVIVIFQLDGEMLHVYDIIAKSNYDLSQVLNEIRSDSSKKVIFHFTVDNQTLAIGTVPFSGTEVLFYKAKESVVLPGVFKHPITSQA